MSLSSELILGCVCNQGRILLSAIQTTLYNVSN